MGVGTGRTRASTAPQGNGTARFFFLLWGRWFLTDGLSSSLLTPLAPSPPSSPTGRRPPWRPLGELPGDAWPNVWGHGREWGRSDAMGAALRGDAPAHAWPRSLWGTTTKGGPGAPAAPLDSRLDWAASPHQGCPPGPVYAPVWRDRGNVSGGRLAGGDRERARRAGAETQIATTRRRCVFFCLLACSRPPPPPTHSHTHLTSSFFPSLRPASASSASTPSPSGWSTCGLTAWRARPRR